MRPALDDPFLRARRYEEVLALRIPADLYIMTDDGTQGDEVLARLNPRSQGKVRFWRNGIDLHRFRPPTPAERREARVVLGLPEEAFIMMTASRLAAWKRVDRAIRALPAVRAWVRDATLVIVGDGEERPALEALADRLAVKDAVRFEGAVRQEDVARYMRAADLFLALADLSNVGNPLLEAMATGMCILTVGAGDTGELIRDGETGRLLDSPQRSGLAEPFERRLADAIVALAGDPALRERLGRAARVYAEAHFWTWEQRLAAEIAEVERVAGVAEP
jgi:glycosyltransferase involved in cell wall biosynthesis